MQRTPTEFKNALLSLNQYYHIHHPFNQALNAGKLSKAQIQAWVMNRFYYQIHIPIKDAAILSNCPDMTVRKHWIKRIIDQDGQDSHEGGITAWLQLGEACDISNETMWSQKHVLPGVKFAVDAYVNFARSATWQEAVCASLTELFSPAIHRERLMTWPEHYPWIAESGLVYFRKRLQEANDDVEHGLAVTLNYFVTAAEQQRAIEILRFKLTVLWSMLDALHLAHVINMPPLQFD